MIAIDSVHLLYAAAMVATFVLGHYNPLGLGAKVKDVLADRPLLRKLAERLEERANAFVDEHLKKITDK
jgi:hypothetical protein